MADDLGYSDLGCYGGEIQTPQLDAIAAKGLRYTQFYNTARCWPTRGALLTGFYAQQIRRDSIPGLISGGQGVRPDWAPLLPKYLKPLGYRSYHTGKWHIDGMPIQQGFDRSYYIKDQSRFFSPTRHSKDDKPLPPVKRNTGFYATTALADHVIEVLKEHQSKHDEKPFFQYLAFAAPHFPLHALPEDIALYENTYSAGWESIRSSRWKRIQKSGLLAGKLSPVESELGPPYHFPDHLKILGNDEVNRPLPWSDLNKSQQKFQADKMAIHAAMIHRMDIEIGRVFDQIKAMDRWENTLILFLSDNGASAEIMVRGDGHDPEAPRGSADTYLCLGPGWSTVSNTPFRRHKTWTHEGGISTPLIVSWENGIAARGEIRRAVGHVIDVVPTILEVTGAADIAPGPESPGKSLVPTFSKDVAVAREKLWWFHDGHKAIRKGNWKAVAEKGGDWELYDLENDRAESENLGKSEPDRVAEMSTEWEATLEEFRKLASEGLSKQRKAAHEKAEQRRAAMKAAQRAAMKRRKSRGN